MDLPFEQCCRHLFLRIRRQWCVMRGMCFRLLVWEKKICFGEFDLLINQHVKVCEIVCHSFMWYLFNVAHTHFANAYTLPNTHSYIYIYLQTHTYLKLTYLQTLTYKLTYKHILTNTYLQTQTYTYTEEPIFSRGQHNITSRNILIPLAQVCESITEFIKAASLD